MQLSDYQSFEWNVCGKFEENLSDFGKFDF